jgi:hypothetical protein
MEKFNYKQNRIVGIDHLQNVTELIFFGITYFGKNHFVEMQHLNYVEHFVIIIFKRSEYQI